MKKIKAITPVVVRPVFACNHHAPILLNQQAIAKLAERLNVIPFKKYYANHRNTINTHDFVRGVMAGVALYSYHDNYAQAILLLNELIRDNQLRLALDYSSATQSFKIRPFTDDHPYLGDTVYQKADLTRNREYKLGCGLGQSMIKMCLCLIRDKSSKPSTKRKPPFAPPPMLLGEIGEL